MASSLSVPLHCFANPLQSFPVGILPILNEDIRADTDLDNGLSTKQVEINRELYGKNELPEAEIKTLFELVMDGFEDKTLQMLSVSAIISLILGLRENPSTGWIEGTAILIAVFIVVFVTAANDYEKVWSANQDKSPSTSGHGCWLM